MAATQPSAHCDNLMHAYGRNAAWGQMADAEERSRRRGRSPAAAGVELVFPTSQGLALHRRARK